MGHCRDRALAAVGYRPSGRRAASNGAVPRRRGRLWTARDLDGKTWRYFGTDYGEAVKGFKAYQRDGSAAPETVAWLLDYFTGVTCPAKVKAGTLRSRTAKDYSNDAEVLKAGVGKMRFKALRPVHIAEFTEARAPGRCGRVTCTPIRATTSSGRPSSGESG